MYDSKGLRSECREREELPAKKKPVKMNYRYSLGRFDVHQLVSEATCSRAAVSVDGIIDGKQAGCYPNGFRIRVILPLTTSRNSRN